MGNCCSRRRKSAEKEKAEFQLSDRSQGAVTADSHALSSSSAIRDSPLQVQAHSGVLRNRHAPALSNPHRSSTPEIGHPGSVDPTPPHDSQVCPDSALPLDQPYRVKDSEPPLQQQISDPLEESYIYPPPSTAPGSVNDNEVKTAGIPQVLSHPLPLKPAGVNDSEARPESVSHDSSNRGVDVASKRESDPVNGVDSTSTLRALSEEGTSANNSEEMKLRTVPGETLADSKPEPPMMVPQVQGVNTVTLFHGAHGFNVGSANTTVVGGNQTTNVTHIHQNGPSVADLETLRAEMRKWLKAPSFSAIHRASKELRTEKTGTWFIQSSEFKGFIQATGCILWCTGKPGSGKTILASTSIEHLQGSIPPNGNTIVAYAYLRYSEQRTLGEILVSLLDQLLALDDAVAKVEPSFRRTKQDGASYTVKELVRVLEDIIGCLSKVYAVIDGLDEASDEVKDGLLQALPPLGINLLIFSRPLKIFTCHTPDAIEVSIQARTDDIALYISEQFEKNARLKALLGGRPDLVEELSNRIKKQADGMFLLARLQLESAMRNATSAKSLFDELEKLPSGVNDMYDLTLKRIDHQPEGLASLAQRLFVWLVYAPQPPSASVIREALAVSIEKRTYEELNITPLELILSACHGLVTVTQDKPVRFRFIHYSTQEYIRSIRPPAIPHPQSFLTAVCVVRLDSHIDIWGKEYDQGGAMNGADKDKSFRGYACRQWDNHLDLSQKAGEDLHPTIVWALSRHTLYPFSPQGGNQLMAPSLAVAAWYGWADIIESKRLYFPIPQRVLLPTISHPNNFNFSTPFHYAIGNLQFDAFMALLSAYGDEIQHVSIWRCSKDNGDSSVLHTALQTSYCLGLKPESLLGFLQKLLAATDSAAFADFNINAQDRHGQTPLTMACQDAKLDVIRLLVEHGGDPLMVDLDMNTALLCAVRHCPKFGYGRWIWTILGRQARRAAAQNHYRAHSNELIEVMRLFLTRHPHLIDQRNKNNETALMLAFSRPRDPAVINYILSQAQLYLHDPEAFSRFINARDEKGQTALMRMCTSNLWPLDNVYENWKILLTTPSINTRTTDRLGRGIMEILCTRNRLISLHSVTIDDYVFPMLYALLDVEVGLDAHTVRKAVIAGVRHLPPGAVYRLLLEDWVVYSFDWSTDNPDTVTLLLQAACRASTYARAAWIPMFQVPAPCLAAVRIVLYYLGLLEPSLLPDGGVQTSNHKELAKVFCGEEGCGCACSKKRWTGRVMGGPRLSTVLERRRSYTPVELELRIRKTPVDQI